LGIERREKLSSLFSRHTQSSVKHKIRHGYESQYSIRQDSKKEKE
jgi:hypothetical protein